MLQPTQAMPVVATRYDKTSSSFQATVTIAALLQWL
jgi:hypothetical protein